MSTPLDSRTSAALEALDRRLTDEHIDMRIYVASGIVMALMYNPDEHPIDISAAADRGDEVLATIGADIARHHGLPPDWLHQIDPRRPTETPAHRTPTRQRIKAILARLRRR